MSKKQTWFVPWTPAGTPCFDLRAKTSEEAWELLLDATAHMPYGSVEALIQRGYEVTSVEY